MRINILNTRLKTSKLLRNVFYHVYCVYMHIKSFSMKWNRYIYTHTQIYDMNDAYADPNSILNNNDIGFLC